MTKLFIVLGFACLATAANPQSITLSLDQAPLEKVIRAIERQSAYRFIYSSEALRLSLPVTIDAREETLETVLATCFRNQPLRYSIDGDYIVVSTAPGKKPAAPPLALTGRIVNENNEPVAGLTVTISGSTLATVTDLSGSFRLEGVEPDAVLLVSGAEIEPLSLPLNGRSALTVTVRTRQNELDKVIVMAYGNTSRRTSTGNISKVAAAEISTQPVSNPLAALQGRVPGLQVTQVSGVNNAGFRVQLRGLNSLTQGAEPFFIIDGVPFSPGNRAINQLSNATDAAGISPFSLINPADIESIEVLKDADATAIYGSRGANGVILITTKKGKAGQATVNAGIYSGWSRVTRRPAMMDTRQYLSVRREAFANDGITPSIYNAPDLLLWDSTRYTDFGTLLMGGTARSTDAQVSINGGSATTRFAAAGSYHRETTLLPVDLADKRITTRLSLTHQSPDERFSLTGSVQYANALNRLTTRDLSGYTRLTPNFKLYDDEGSLNWEEGGVSYYDLGFADEPNPLAFLQRRYRGRFQNMVGNLQLGYLILPSLTFRLSGGYNLLVGDEITTNPSSSIDPFSGLLPNSAFANGTQSSWIAEPQLEYARTFGRLRLTLLTGGTWQEQKSEAVSIDARDYSNYLFLASIAAAGSVTATNSYDQYRYTAAFGRLQFNWNQQYLLNISGRRDGSSRFGPDNQFGNFAAAGAAWIFSNHRLLRNSPVLSFGKLRASYGTAGNDQIGNYRYLDTWTVSGSNYQGVSTFRPTSLYNPAYAWEINRKLEAALELGFLKDRLYFSAAWFRNRSSNQLVNYTLPVQTGFSSIGRNLDALVQNSGLEFQLNATVLNKAAFRWTSVLTLSAIRNKLVRFPGLAASSYANVYTEGKPVNSVRVLHYTGIDPATGYYSFEDADKNGVLDAADQVKVVDLNPRYYGGWLHSLSYGSFKLDLFFEFRRQRGRLYYGSGDIATPGFGNQNRPVATLDYWQQAGDAATFQRPTAIRSAGWLAGAYYFPQSDGLYGDASFIRCKNLSLSYTILPNAKKVATIRCYIQAQNLFVITRYQVTDPETQDLRALPPLRTIAAGVTISF